MRSYDWQALTFSEDVNAQTPFSFTSKAPHLPYLAIKMMWYFPLKGFVLIDVPLTFERIIERRIWCIYPGWEFASPIGVT
ncbi:MAG: hypothetical protein COA43_00105 [Robiginitomaculum sp.]|nr:MAG: hypothetical protein COA43_00105 [Robiginitomaculum sp.]